MAERPQGYGFTAEVSEKINSKYDPELGKFLYISLSRFVIFVVFTIALEICTGKMERKKFFLKK